MRTLVTILLCLTLGLVFGCAYEPTADSVVADMTSAQGGAEKLAATTDQVTSWDFTMHMGPPQAVGMVMPMTITYKKPDKLRFDGEMNGQVIFSACYDGEKYWEMEMGQHKEGTPEQVQESQFNAATWLGLHDYQNSGLTLELLPDDSLDGSAYTVLKTTHENGFSHNLYIDKASKMVVRSVGPMANPEGGFIQSYMVMSDYKMADGFPLAHHVAQYTEEGAMIWEATMTGAQHNTGVEDSFFMMPEEEISMK